MEHGWPAWVDAEVVHVQTARSEGGGVVVVGPPEAYDR
jgi:hypothetical protein